MGHRHLEEHSYFWLVCDTLAMLRQTSALLLLASAGASTIQCDGNTVVIRTGKFSVSEDLAAFSAFVQQVSPNSTAACCTGNDYEAAWAGDALAIFPSCPAFVADLKKQGYGGPELECLTAPGGMSWTKQGGQALTSANCTGALDWMKGHGLK